jgi:DNA-binding LacI/PurR family transcriptional regulator
MIGINDLTAIGAMCAALEYRLQPGNDLIVVGFDDLSGAETVQSALTTLNQPVYKIGRRLIGMLCKLISEEPLDEQQILLKPDLVVRESSRGLFRPV